MNQNKIKIFGIILGVILFILFISGITYAAFTWASDPTGGFINGTSECFKIDYTKGNDITEGTLILGDSYADGLSATVKAKINDSCPTMKGIATLYVDVKDETSSFLIENSLLRYQVLEDGVEVSSGILSSKGDNEVYKNIEITSIEKSFIVYIWVSKNDIDDNNLESITSSTYSVGIKMSAEGR